MVLNCFGHSFGWCLSVLGVDLAVLVMDLAVLGMALSSLGCGNPVGESPRASKRAAGRGSGEETREEEVRESGRGAAGKGKGAGTQKGARAPRPKGRGTRTSFHFLPSKTLMFGLTVMTRCVQIVSFSSRKVFRPRSLCHVHFGACTGKKSKQNTLM